MGPDLDLIWDGQSDTAQNPSRLIAWLNIEQTPGQRKTQRKRAQGPGPSREAHHAWRMPKLDSWDSMEVSRVEIEKLEPMSGASGGWTSVYFTDAENAGFGGQKQGFALDGADQIGPPTQTKRCRLGE